jgi:hypothetical protein
MRVTGVVDVVLIGLRCYQTIAQNKPVVWSLILFGFILFVYLIAFAGVAIRRETAFPAVVPRTAPDSVFSGARALPHAEYLSQSLGPRPIGL